MQVVKSIARYFVQKQQVSAMGTPFQISVVTTDAGWAEERIETAIAEIKRIEKMLTSLSTDSIANQINYSAGIAPVKINGELFRLIDRSLKIAELTNGAYDITYGTEYSYLKVELNAAENTVFLKDKNMRIYFGGIAKGYAADRAKYILQIEGVSGGVIKCDSNLVTWGVQADGRQWTIGDADTELEAMPYADYIISNMAVATSANRQTNLKEDIQSICVMSTSAELSGAMTSPVIGLGVKAGTQLVDALQQLACVFVDSRNQMFSSKFMSALN